MAGAKIQGYISGNVMEVDANDNVHVNLPVAESQAGYSALAGVVSEGITAPISQPRLVRRVEASNSFRARCGIDSLEFFDYFGGSSGVMNTSNWFQSFSGTQTTGAITGTFTAGDNLVQLTSLATSTIVTTATGSPASILLQNVVGTLDGTHVIDDNTGGGTLTTGAITGTFTAGQVVTGVTSGATGIIHATTTTSPVAITNISGQAAFANGESIWTVSPSTNFATTSSAITFTNHATATGTLTTMTVTIAEGFMNLNAAGSVTSGAGVYVATYRTLPYYADAALRCDLKLKIQQVPQANNTLEWGLGMGIGSSSAPTDGAFWRITGAGNLTCVATNNTTEQTVSLNFQPQVNVVYEYSIIIDSRQAFFYINSQLYAVISAYTTNIASITASNQQRIFFRCDNTGTTTLAQQLKVASVSATLLDIGAGRTWVESMCGAGQNAVQFGSGTNVGQTAYYANNGGPTSQAANNTTQGNAAYTLKLGGQFLLTNPAAAAADTDEIIFNFLNPVGTAAIQGRTLYITGIRIDAIQFGATNSTNYNTVQWALNVGATAISDAVVADTNAGVKQYRRIPFGNVNVATLAIVGTQYGEQWGNASNVYQLGLPGYPGTPCHINFQSPLMVNAGEFVTVTGRFWQTGATASVTIRGTCMINGHWE